MRVLLISRCPPYPLHLGDRLIVYHLARELHLRGHIIDLLAYTNPHQASPEQTAYAHLFGQITLMPEPVRPLASYAQRQLIPAARWPRHAEETWSPEMWHTIQAYRTQHHYDVAHLFGGIQVYEFFHALNDLPALITPYESYSLYLRRSRAAGFNSLGARAQHWMAQRYESWMFSPYRWTVVVSEQDRDELQQLNPHTSIAVISNGVDLNTFQPDNSVREPNTLLFVGNYEYAPNVDAAIWLAKDIFEQVRTRIHGAKLWLVGNAPPPELMALASDHITVTGRVPDVKPYLARAAVFVSALRLGAGIKNKVLEAMAMGTPVAATPLSMDGIAAHDGHEALIAPEDELAAAVIRMLSDDALRERVGNNGRRLIEMRYSWTAVAEQYEALYQEIT